MQTETSAKDILNYNDKQSELGLTIRLVPTLLFLSVVGYIVYQAGVASACSK